MVCVMSPMVTSGRLLAASSAISSLLEVYTSFQLPSSMSFASVGEGVGFLASSCASSSLISARTSLLALSPLSVPNSESRSAILSSSTVILVAGGGGGAVTAVGSGSSSAAARGLGIGRAGQPFFTPDGSGDANMLLRLAGRLARRATVAGARAPATPKETRAAILTQGNTGFHGELVRARSSGGQQAVSSGVLRLVLRLQLPVVRS
mmetsp:Transcript_47549/g.121339  ORF Transcript_47549/g.121339 Transcript_47549/m.121339 type:complete len:207 (-) Transcript_47549:13-633(-)